MTPVTLLPPPRPVQLQPVPFGTRDPKLAKIVCQSIQDAMPPLQVRWTPRVFKAVRRALQGVGVTW